MIRFFELLWDSLTIPLAWMPDFCLRVIAALGVFIVLTIIIPLVAQLAQIVASILSK